MRKIAFTLAEVLITLAIIGVVAAMTMPTLIQKYQKHVWYVQFKKAVSILENAINMYNYDHACGAKLPDTEGIDNLCIYSDTSSSVADKLGEYINVSKWINDENYEEVCAGYNKLPPSYLYDGSGRDNSGIYYCTDDKPTRPEAVKKNGYAFITVDGMLFNTELDMGINGNGSIVDVNGPNKGPNIEGRDIFTFFLLNDKSTRWGFPKEEHNACYDDDKQGENCGLRLLQEGKMNY